MSCTDVAWREVSGRGRLLYHGINHRPMPPVDSPEPQVIALVELAEGRRMLTNIVDSPAAPDALPLDGDVVVGFTPRGDWQLPVLRLVTAASNGAAEPSHDRPAGAR